MGILFRTAQDEVPDCLSGCCCLCCPCPFLRRLRIPIRLWRLWPHLRPARRAHRGQGCLRSCCLSLCCLPPICLWRLHWLPICPRCLRRLPHRCCHSCCCQEVC